MTLVISLLALLVALVVSLLALVVSLLPFFTSFNIFSVNLFRYFYLPLRAASTRFGPLSFVTFCDALSMFILRVQRKRVETNTDPIFEHPVFDSAREKMKRFKKQLEKSQETFESSLHTCFKCGTNSVFLLQNRSVLLTKELYLVSSKIATINGGTDDTHYAVNVLSKFEQ